MLGTSLEALILASQCPKEDQICTKAEINGNTTIVPRTDFLPDVLRRYTVNFGMKLSHCPAKRRRSSGLTKDRAILKRQRLDRGAPKTEKETCHIFILCFCFLLVVILVPPTDVFLPETAAKEFLCEREVAIDNLAQQTAASKIALRQESMLGAPIPAEDPDVLNSLATHRFHAVDQKAAKMLARKKQRFDASNAGVDVQTGASCSQAASSSKVRWAEQHKETSVDQARPTPGMALVMGGVSERRAHPGRKRF